MFMTQFLNKLDAYFEYKMPFFSPIYLRKYLKNPSVDPRPDSLLLTSGLPDCIFSNQKSQFWEILEGLAIGGVVILYDHLVYFTAIWYILW
jgi:hypothetical protein